MSANSCKRSRASAEQLNYLVDFLTENPGLATEKLQKLRGKVEFGKMWMQLVQSLNSLGETVTTIEQWQTVWRDLKSCTSIKVRERKKLQALTGNKPVHQEPLTELERKVVAITGSHYIEGHECVAENVPSEENFQLRWEEGDEFTVFEAQSTAALEIPCTPFKRTPRALKRKRDEGDNIMRSKFLEIADKQADAIKLLAECSADCVKNHKLPLEAQQSLGEGLKIIGEGLKAYADAINILARALNNFVCNN